MSSVGIIIGQNESVIFLKKVVTVPASVYNGCKSIVDFKVLTVVERLL